MGKPLLAGFLSALGALACLALGAYVVANWGGPLDRPFLAERPGLAQPAAVPTTVRVPAQGVAPTAVPILMYHYVRTVSQADDPLGYDLSVTPDLFARQLDALATAGYTAVTPAQFLTGRIPAKSVILSFDDGYTDLFSAVYPALAARGMTAVAFVITGKLDDPDGRYLTRTQVKALADAGIEIGSHTVSHLNLATAPPQRVRDELLVSRQVLEQLTGRPVTAVSYPSGKVTDEVARTADYVGYTFGVTTVSGVATPDSVRLLLPRIRVRGSESPDELLAALARSAADETDVLPGVSDPLEP